MPRRVLSALGPDRQAAHWLEPAVEIAPGDHEDEPRPAVGAPEGSARGSLEQDGALELDGARVLIEEESGSAHFPIVGNEGAVASDANRASSRTRRAGQLPGGA